MAINCCSSGLVATAVVAILLLPAQYLVPDLYPGLDESSPLQQAEPEGVLAWLDSALAHFPPLDILFTLSLLSLGLLTYLYGWIHRKLLERRITKLNRYLSASLERLRAWDAQQEQLEATIKMVQNATSEYNLLLYLLLRQHRCLAAHGGPPSNCFFDKTMEDDFIFFNNPIIEA